MELFKYGICFFIGFAVSRVGDKRFAYPDRFYGFFKHKKTVSSLFMGWAVGEKELKYYPDGDHVCANYMDGVIPYSIDWLKKRLAKQDN